MLRCVNTSASEKPAKGKVGQSIVLNWIPIPIYIIPYLFSNLWALAKLRKHAVPPAGTMSFLKYGLFNFYDIA